MNKISYKTIKKTNNLETAEDTKKYNSLTTCYLIIKEIIEQSEERQTIPF